MKRAVCKLSSVSPYGQNKMIFEKKDRNETHEDFEERTWKRRAHVDNDGVCFIPPMCFKKTIAEAAKYKSIQIPGKGKSTYTKHFEAGILVTEPLSLGVREDQLDNYMHRQAVPSDGRPGGKTRVVKNFPAFPEWSGTVEFLVLDEIIDNEVFHEHLTDAGQFIGVGWFRPRNGGYWGRFKVEEITWE